MRIGDEVRRRAHHELVGCEELEGAEVTHHLRGGDEVHAGRRRGELGHVEIGDDIRLDLLHHPRAAADHPLADDVVRGIGVEAPPDIAVHPTCEIASDRGIQRPGDRVLPIGAVDGVSGLLGCSARSIRGSEHVRADRRDEPTVLRDGRLGGIDLLPSSDDGLTVLFQRGVDRVHIGGLDPRDHPLKLEVGGFQIDLGVGDELLSCDLVRLKELRLLCESGLDLGGVDAFRGDRGSHGTLRELASLRPREELNDVLLTARERGGHLATRRGRDGPDDG